MAAEKAGFDGIMDAAESAVVSNRFLQVTDKLAYFFLLLFCAECAFGSSGKWLMAGPVSIRILLFTLAMAFSLPTVWSMRRRLVKVPYLYILAAFAAWLAVSAAIGLSNGNPVIFVRNDVTSFLTLALVPGGVLTLRTKKRLYRTADAMFYVSAALALVVLYIHYLTPFRKEDLYPINDTINHLQLGGLADIGLGVLRIYFRSQIFLQLTILIGMWKTVRAFRTRSKMRFAYIGITGILMYALILSFVRGFWVGFLLALAVLFVFVRGKRIQYLKALAAAVGVSLIFTGVSWAAYGEPSVVYAIVNRFDSPLMVIFPEWSGNIDLLVPNDDSSDLIFDDPNLTKANVEAANIRMESITAQYRLSSERPVLGWGLGKNLDGIRSDGKTEYMYWDLLTKTGLIGIALLALVCAWHPAGLARIGWRRWRKRLPPASTDSAIHFAGIFAAGFFSVAATSYVNPYLASPLGLSIMITAMATCVLARQEESREAADTGTGAAGGDLDSESSVFLAECAVVLYNCRCADSKSLGSLLGAEVPGVRIKIYDNSTAGDIKEENLRFCLDRGLPYTDMHGNAGLAKAYNTAVARMGNSSWLVLFDEDTTVAEGYFAALRESVRKYPDAWIHVPVVRSGNSVISPSAVRGHSVRRLKSVPPGILPNVTAINTGMAVSRQVFDRIGRYSEEYFLDYLDHDFVRQFRNAGGKLAVFSSELIQEFSDDDHSNRERDLRRFAIYRRDFRQYCRDTIGGILYFYLKIYYRAFKLARIHHSADFVAVAAGMRYVREGKNHG